MSRLLGSLKIKLPSFTRWRENSNNLATVDLKNHKWTWVTHLAGKILIIGAMLTAIGFGGSSRVFTIEAKEILGSTVDADLQLAFLGLINKILDLFVTKALQVTAGVIITLWMTQGPGIRLADFELGEELTKPWAAVSKFQGRWSSLGWKNAGWWRILITLPISVCVLLQGLAINTIGVPKERWYPDEGSEHVVIHPVARFQGFNWENSWEAAWRTVGGGGMSWRFSSGYIASSSYLAFQKFSWLMKREPYGWRQFGFGDSEFPALDTRYNASSSRGIALHVTQSSEVFNWLKENGTGHARRAVGLHGNIMLVSPSTLVTCRPIDERRGGQTSSSARSSITVDVPADETATTFSVDVMHPETYTRGATCSISVCRVLFPADVWIIDGSDNPTASVNKWEKKYDIAPEEIPTQPFDATMAHALARQFQDTTQRLEHIVDNMTSAQWLSEIAREVHFRRNDSYKTDIEALAPVVTLLATQLLDSALWNVTYLNDQPQVESKIRWQLYGSGPRLPWAWSAAIVLGVLTLAIVGSIGLSCWYTIVPAEFLKASGMLVAANSSPSVENLSLALKSKEKHKLDSLQFGVRASSHQLGVVEIVNAESRSDTLALDKSYKWAA